MSSYYQHVSYDSTGRPYLHLTLPAPMAFPIDHEAPDKETSESVVIIDMTKDDLQTYEL